MSHSGSHHSFDMKKDMGGLRKYMPITFWTFMIGIARARRDLPARRLLVEGRDPRRPPGRTGYDVFLVVGLVGAFMTAAYMTRCVYLTFFGEYRGHGHAARVAAGRSPVPLDRPRRSSAVVRRSRSTPRRSTSRSSREWTSSRRVVASRASCTPDVRLRRLAVRSRSRSPRIGASASPRLLLVQARGARRAKGLTERNRLARRRLHVPGEQVLPRRPLRPTSSSAAIKGPIATGRRTGSTST